MLEKIKQLFNYRKRWKQQKNRNKNLRKKVNKLSQGISEELKLDVTNEEIKKLKQEIIRLRKQVIKLDLEAQKYFDELMDHLYKQKDNYELNKNE